MKLQSDEIAQWRARVFTLILPAVLAFGVLAAVPSVVVAIGSGQWQGTVIRLLSLVWVAAIWRCPGSAYPLRVLGFLAMLYLFAIGLMLHSGPRALPYLMAPPIMAVILLGLRPALLMLALCALSLLAITLDGWSALQAGGMQAAFFSILNFVCVCGLITLTCGTLLEHLARALADARQATTRLETVNHEMRLTSEAIARLNDLVLIARMVDAPGAIQPITFANDAFLRHTGYAREEVVGRSVRMFEGPDTDQASIADMIEAIGRRQPAKAELLHYKRDGTSYWVEVEMMPFAGESGAITHWVIVGRDITERRTAAAAIDRLASYDGLTGLPNRHLLMTRLAAMVDAAAHGRSMGALLYVDLDNFKTINDARGHAIGDLVLVQAAQRLAALMGAHDSVARLGGDEFVVLLGELGTDGGSVGALALACAGRIRAALSGPMDIEGQRHYISASIGVALATHGGQDGHDLLREADIAMYRAKALGLDGVAQFAPAMLEQAERRLALERGLAQALERGELALHLQLQVDHGGRASGAELLMRWRRQDGAMVPPDVFIPVAESSGQIVALGEWALRQDCQAWHALQRAGYALPLSVNVSPVQFRQPDFVALVEAILRDTGVPPGGLIFEVTEGLLVDRQDQTIARMHALASLGIRISIDDFGTGYSSLAYLTRMPLYELKIDKSFIRDTPHDAHATAIVHSVLSMARHLGLRVVAEGIEHQSQAAWLAQHGNASMQGYLFHRPMPLDALIAHLGTAERDFS